MKIRNKRKISKKTILLGSIIAVVLLATVGLGAYLYKFHGSLFGWQPNPKQQSSSIDYKAPTVEQKNAGSQTKQQSLSSQDKGTAGTDQPPAPVPQSNGPSVVQVTITAANQTTSVLQVRTQIDTVTDNGTCTITLTKSGSSSVTQTAQTQSYASISTCKGFDIPLSQLPVGQWNVAIHFSSSNLVGDTSKSVTIH